MSRAKDRFTFSQSIIKGPWGAESFAGNGKGAVFTGSFFGSSTVFLGNLGLLWVLDGGSIGLLDFRCKVGDIVKLTAGLGFDSGFGLG